MSEIINHLQTVNYNLSNGALSDLKPSNVLISDQGEAVICDFNSSIPLIQELPHQCDCFNRKADDSSKRNTSPIFSVRSLDVGHQSSVCIPTA